MAAPHDDAEVSDPLKSGGAPEPPCRNPGGRPPHQPTEEARRQVQRMAGDGLTHAQIARVMRLGETTLKRHYPEELARGAALATATVGRSLFRMATDWMTPGEDGRPRAPDRAAVAAAIFWMKARAGWREKHDITVRPGVPLTELSDDELRRIVLGSVREEDAPALPP